MGTGAIKKLNFNTDFKDLPSVSKYILCDKHATAILNITFITPFGIMYEIKT